MKTAAYHPFRSEKATQRYLAHYALRAAKWPVPSEERMVETSFGRTFVRVSGSSNTPPLLMLPGVGSSSLSLSMNVKELSLRFETFAVDNIYDNGLSVATRPIQNADDFTDWLDELCTALGLTAEVNFWGLSYGGWISLQFALRFPNRVRRLALLAPAGTLAPIPWGFIWRAVLCAIPLKFFMNNFMNWVRVTDDVDEETKKGLDDIAEDGWISNRSFRPRRMVPPIPPTDDQWRKLSVPTLILAGDREVIFPAEKSLARVAALSPLIETALLNGMGHDFFQARAKDVNRLVLDFLEAK